MAITTRRSARMKAARAEEARKVQQARSSPVAGDEPNEHTTSPIKTPAAVSPAPGTGAEPALDRTPAAKSASPPLHDSAESRKDPSSPQLNSRKRSSTSPVTPSKKAKLSHEEEPVKSIEDVGQTTKNSSPPGDSAPPEDDKIAPQTPKKTSTSPPAEYPSPPEVQATALDKATWQGFCEIESDPCYFSVMVREMGVKGISVKEIFGMDPDSKAMISRPVHGLILLFRYRALDEEDDEQECPKNVWFANQMPNQNSCATLAMLNILMNAKDVDIGENLRQFQAFTEGLTPYFRGQEIAHFDFVKTIHNSFAKKMDMLQTDLQLKENHDRGRKKARVSPNDSPTPPGDEAAHHFIAFVPIDGKVWKLDGMDKVPTLVGTFADGAEDWLEIAEQKLTEIMSQGGGDSYALFGMVQAPVVGLRQELCVNVKTLEAIEGRLKGINDQWDEFIPSDDLDPAVRDADFLSGFGISLEELSAAAVSENIASIIQFEDWNDLVERRGRLESENRRLQANILVEMQNESEENEKAVERRWDYGPVISKWLKKLVANGYLDEHLDEVL